MEPVLSIWNFREGTAMKKSRKSYERQPLSMNEIREIERLLEEGKIVLSEGERRWIRMLTMGSALMREAFKDEESNGDSKLRVMV